MAQEINLLHELLNATFSELEEGSVGNPVLVAESFTGKQIVVEEVDGKVWLNIIVYDEDMEDGREIEYEIARLDGE